MIGAFKSCLVDDCNSNAHRSANGIRGMCNAHYLRWKRHGDPVAGDPMRGDAVKYLREVVFPHNADECLIWPFARKEDGRAIIRNGGRCAYVSRIVCSETHGPAPSPKHEAAHSCGKGHLACVSPLHLRWATRIENETDKLAHGTKVIGERVGSAKLTADQVTRLRSLKGKVSQKGAAKMFGVSQSLVCRIQSREVWSWLQ